MAYVNTARPIEFPVIAQIQDYLARRAAYHQTFNELSDLSDRDLADLGISRSAIRVLAKEAADNI